jgi:serine/threonine protein kinase
MLAMTTPPDAVAGRVLDGKYVLHAAIGGGRFGVVYRATHIALQKPVAVKVLGTGDGLAARDFEQFRVEAEALGRLAHAHIVGVADFGVDPTGGGTPYLVMELVEGRTLEDICRDEGAIDLERAAVWLSQVAEAVDHAHQQGVTHGDLTARNVIVSATGRDTSAKVIDFGLARLAEWQPAASPRHTDAEAADGFRARFTGTPEYAAPELVRGTAASAASDVYAFTVLAWRLITGSHPFEGDTRAVLHAQLTAEPAPLLPALAHLPPAVGTALRLGLAKRAENRPPAARDIAERVGAAARDLARARWRRREAPRRVALSAAIATGLAALGPALAAVDAVHRLEGASQDVRFALSAARAPDPRLLLVAIDDDSLAADPRPLSVRGDDIASALDRVFDLGAAAVALDLLLPETWSRAPRFGDLLLNRSDRLVLALVAGDETALVGPEAIDPLVAGALGRDKTSRLFGLVSQSAAPDGVVRRARRAITDRSGQTRMTLGGRIAEIVDAPGVVAASTTDEFPVDYRVDATRLDRLSWKALSEALAANTRFDDRVVLVGAEYTGSGDSHRGPAPGRLPAPLTGLALQGVITSTLLQGPAMRNAPGLWVWPLVGAFLAGATASLLWARRSLTGAAGALAALVAWVAATLVAFRLGVIAPVAAPVVLWVAASGGAVVARTRLSPVPE